jgi:hypothetical protein
MRWTCPDCKRDFRTTNQWHSCNLTDVNDHLKDKPASIVATIEKLLDVGLQLEGTELVTVKSSVSVKVGAKFLSLYPSKTRIEVWFYSSEEIEEFPVYKSTRISGKRVLNQLVVESPEEVDEQLIHWIQASYAIVSKAQ